MNGSKPNLLATALMSVLTGIFSENILPREWLIVVRAGSHTIVKVITSLATPSNPPVAVETI